MRLTRRGIATAFVGASFLFASLFYSDFILGSIVLVVLILLGTESLWVLLVVSNPSKRFSFEQAQDLEARGKGGAVSYPGEESVEHVRFWKRAGGKVELTSTLQFLQIVPRVLAGKEREKSLMLTFKTPYASDYRVDTINLKVTGPLGLVSSSCSLDLKRRFSVYPRLLSVASATLKLLGRGGIGETPIDFPGIGTEFYEMREYHSGDDFRKINWKATARHGELVVNEHMREVGLSFFLMLDATAPGFFDADRLASTFLSVANTLAVLGVKFGVLVHKAGSLVVASPEENPRASLEVALRAALDFTGLGSQVGMAELAPVRAVAVETTGANLEPAFGIQRIMRSEVMTALQMVDAWKTASDSIKESSTQSVIYITGLFGAIEPIIELAWQARHYRDIDFVVADPCQPWAEAKDEAEARDIFVRHQRLTKALGTAGIPCYGGEPLDVARRIFTI